MDNEKQEKIEQTLMLAHAQYLLQQLSPHERDDMNWHKAVLLCGKPCEIMSIGVDDDALLVRHFTGPEQTMQMFYVLLKTGRFRFVVTQTETC